MYTVSELCLCQCRYNKCNVYQCQVYKYIQSNNQNKTCQKSIKNEDTTNTCNLSKPRIDRWLHHHRALEVMAPWIRNEQFKQATWQHGNGNKKHMVTVLFWGKTHTHSQGNWGGTYRNHLWGTNKSFSGKKKWWLKYPVENPCLSRLRCTEDSLHKKCTGGPCLSKTHKPLLSTREQTRNIILHKCLDVC